MIARTKVSGTRRFRIALRYWSAAVFFGSALALAHAAEHITLNTGFEIDCARREPVGEDRVRLFLLPTTGITETSYIDIASSAVVRIEAFPDPMPLPVLKVSPTTQNEPTAAELHTILARAGAQHHIDEDLLASVVKAESGGRVLAVSRTGARGLMQLMPGTASDMGVTDAFRADQNVAGGTAYLDQLLVRYHDNAALALAAYNAGPGAVDKYRGIPPYRETRAYVARVIREFNRRKQAAATHIEIASALAQAKP